MRFLRSSRTCKSSLARPRTNISAEGLHHSAFSFSGSAQTIIIVEFETFSAAEKTSYVLGSKNWEDDFNVLLHLVKEFIVAVWEVRKQKLHGDDSYPGQLQRQSSTRDRGPVAGVGGRVGKSGKFGVSCGKGEDHVVHAGGNCVCGSAHSCGCVVNGYGSLLSIIIHFLLVVVVVLQF